jgi:hypothetical protein
MPRRLTAVIGVATVVLVFALGVLIGAGPGRSWALGNLAEWLTALGLVFAGAGLVFQSRQLTDQREAAVRAQAEAVTFYRVPDQGETKAGPGHDPKSGKHNLLERLTYVVVNGSALPVTDVEVLVMFPPDDGRDRAQQLRYGVVSGNEPHGGPPREQCWVDSSLDDWPAAWLGFTDASGRRWSRPLDGGPQRSGETPDDPTAWEQGLCDVIGLCRVRPADPHPARR